MVAGMGLVVAGATEPVTPTGKFLTRSFALSGSCRNQQMLSPRPRRRTAGDRRSPLRLDSLNPKDLSDRRARTSICPARTFEPK
jgi:hypothetical protein